MIITFWDGKKAEATSVSQNGSTMRVAVKGTDELVDFTCISGQWLSENCEPVEVEFAWQRVTRTKTVTVDECICSQEMANRLIQRLYIDTADEVRSAAVGG